MKLKIATRVFNSEYFLDFFFKYYLDLGVDEIYIFDSSSTDRTLDIIKNWKEKNDRIALVLSNEKFRYTTNQIETKICNYILKFAINDYIQKREDSWWIFLDIDEYIQSFNDLSLKDYLNNQYNDIIRAIFLDWYLPPKTINKNLKPNEIFDLIFSGKIKGKISYLWDDPFHKDYIIRLNNHTIKKFKRIRTSGGFHRLILDEQIHLPLNRPFIIVNHLKGIPIHVIRKKILERGKILKNVKDDWNKEHFLIEKQRYEDYDRFYNRRELKPVEDLKTLIKNMPSYDNRQSFYNNVIIKEDIQVPGGSRPSMHINHKVDS